MDAVRRQNEVQLIEQLRELTDEAEKTDKSSVLQAALTKLTELDSSFTALQQAVVEQEAQLKAALSDTFNSQVEWGNRTITSFVHSQALLSACFEQASVGLLMMDALTGLCINANHKYLTTAGWTREQVLGKLLIAPYSVCMSYEHGAFRAPGSSAFMDEHEDERPLVRMQWRPQLQAADDADETEWVRADGCDQYPASVQLTKELYSGQREAMQAVWRCRWADGFVHEQMQVSWVSERTWTAEEDGARRMIPLTVVFASGFSDVVKVDELTNQRVQD